MAAWVRQYELPRTIRTWEDFTSSYRSGIRQTGEDRFSGNSKPPPPLSGFAYKHALKLRPKLVQELKPGTRVVSNTFDMRDWRPEKEQLVPGADDDEAAYLSHKFFLWTIPRREAE